MSTRGSPTHGGGRERTTIGGAAIQQQRQEVILARLREQHATITRWLANHSSDHPKYGEAEYIHERLSAEIAERENALRAQEKAGPSDMPKADGSEPRGSAAAREIMSLAAQIQRAEAYLPRVRDAQERADLQQRIKTLREQLQTAQAAQTVGAPKISPTGREMLRLNAAETNAKARLASEQDPAKRAKLEGQLAAIAQRRAEIAPAHQEAMQERRRQERARYDAKHTATERNARWQAAHPGMDRATYERERKAAQRAKKGGGS